MHPHRSLCTLDYHWVLRVMRAFTIGNPLGCQGSACVEVMTTLHGSTPSLRRRIEGCIPSKGTITSARDLWKSTHIHLGSPWPCRMSLDPLIRIPSSHVGASESLQSHFSHHLGSVFSFLGLHLRVLRDWYEFEYQLDHLCHVALVSTFPSMNFVIFLPRVFVFFS